MGHRMWAPVGLAVVGFLAAACGSSSTSPTASGSPSATSASAASSSSTASAGKVVRTVKIGSAAVLTNAHGRTLYWFSRDTATVSKCTSTTCVHFWPVVEGTVIAGPGVTGAHKLGTIMRSDGLIQATYNGHPIYTYIGDTASGQAKGNGLNVSGGVWHEVTVSGAAAPRLSPSSSPGGGGY